MDPDEARRRILEELARGEYGGDGEGFIPWLLDQISAWFADLMGGSDGPSAVQIGVLVAACALALLIAVLVLRRTGVIRRDRALTAPVSLQADSRLSAAELRDRARGAIDAQSWSEATVLGMRAIVRDLQERTLLEVTEGMTAHEAALESGRVFPDLTGRLALAARSFDQAAYSRHRVSAKQAQDVVRLAEYLAGARPELVRA